MAKQELGPLQRKWVEALRSGEYRQTKGYLLMEGAYCCLGVACLSIGLSPEHALGADVFDGSYVAVLPPLVKDGMRFRGWCGEFRNATDDERYQSLADLNDGGKTFDEIADFVEAHSEAVFTEPA